MGARRYGAGRIQLPPGAGGGGGGYDTVEDEGTPVTQRTDLNFAGAGVTVTDSGGKTLVTISGGGGGGGGDSILTRAMKGLLHYTGFGGPNLNVGASGEEYAFAARSGTWGQDGGVLASTTGGNDEQLMCVAPYALNMVVEARLRTTNAGTVYFGVWARVQPTATRQDFGCLIKHNDAQLNYHDSGGVLQTGASSAAHAIVSNTWYNLKLAVRQGAALGTNYVSIWVDHTSWWTDQGLGVGPFAPGFAGVGGYGGVGGEYDWLSVYKDRYIRFHGMQGTEAVRLFDASDTPVEDTAEQDDGLCRMDAFQFPVPFEGYFKVYTDDTWGTEVTDGRFPASGVLSDIAGGDIYVRAV